MKKIVKYTDLEREFLETIGISFKDNYLFRYDTECVFSYIGSNKEPIAELNYQKGYITYEFKGKDGSIIFARAIGTPNDFTPSIVVKLNDYELSFNESYYHRNYYIPEEEMQKESSHFLKEIKDFQIVIKPKDDNTKVMNMHFVQPHGTDLSTTYIINNEKKRGEIHLQPSATSSIIFLGNDNIYDVYDGINEEKYVDYLIYIIKVVFEDRPDIANIYLDFLPMFIKAYNVSLHIPAIRKESLKGLYQNSRRILTKYFADRINNSKPEEHERLKSELEKALIRVNSEEERIKEIIEQYPLYSGRKK